MNAVFRKELRTYFTGFLGYLFMAVLLVIIGIYCMIYNLSYQYSAFEYVYGSVSFIYLIVIPILTMRVFPEERKLKTEQLLYSLPLKMSEIVCGKYFAALVILAIPLAVSAVYPVILSAYGTVNFGIVYTTLLGFFLLGAALAAVCMFISSLTENQILAAIFSFIVLFINYFIGNLTNYFSSSTGAGFISLTAVILAVALLVRLVTKNKFLARITLAVLLAALIAVAVINSSLIAGIAGKVLGKLALFDGFYNIVYGIFDLKTILLYISTAVIFTFLTVQALERRRWA